jgi:uncharacterized membrane protein
MNAAHLHLLISHAPMMAVISGLILLLLGLLKKSEELKQTSLLFFVLGGAAAVPAYLTGAPARDMLVKMPVPISVNITDQHGDVAILAFAAALVLGIVALSGLMRYRRGRSLPGLFLFVILVLALTTGAAMGWTSHLGGKIRHPELRVRSQHLTFDGWARTLTGRESRISP